MRQVRPSSALGAAPLRLCALAAVFLGVFLISFSLGRYPVSPAELFSLLFSGPGGWATPVGTVILQNRMPRLLAAALIGAALSVAGVCYQGMFQNPMVSPDILGASSGAGFGAALGILLSLGYLGISLAAFCSGLAAVLLAYAVSRAGRGGVALSMVLSGMMVSALFTSATSYVKLIADTDSVLPAITYWLMGSLASIRWKDVVFAGIPILAGLLPLFLLRWRLNLLTLGEEEARSMGVNTAGLRLIVILCATLLTASSVAVSGLIGWVGLVIPHFCRRLFGYDYRLLIPASALLGGAFLILVDDCARLIATSEVPLGILTSFVGAPVFLYFILKGGAAHEA